MDRYYFVFEGLSGSSAGNPVSDMVRHFGPFRTMPTGGNKVAAKSIETIITLTEQRNLDTVIVGKSFGAILIIRAFWKHSPIIGPNGRIKLVLIDGHSLFGYGAFRRAISGKNLPERTVNIYQRNYWPKGVRVSGVKNILLPEPYDHFNIPFSSDVVRELRKS